MGIDPVSIGLMGLSALSAVAGSQAQKQQSKYQAQVAQNNAAIANMNATYAERAGAAKEQSEAYKIRGLLGQQAAGQAASGLDVNSGSAVDVRRGTAGLGNLSFANIRDNTAREAAGYRGQATNFANDAALAKASAPTPFSTILGAASAAGGTYAGLGGGNPFASATGGLGATTRQAVERPALSSLFV